MILLLHGFAGEPSVWDGIVTADATAIALPGHAGAAIHGDWDANLDAIVAVARACGARLAIGYSLGARIALGLVARGAVERAILVGVNPGLAADDPERATRRARDAAWAAQLRTEGTAAFLAAWQAQPLFASQARFPARVAARATRRAALDPEGLALSLETMGLAAMPDYRAAIGPRTTLVAGALDAKYTTLMAAHPAAAARATIADSGHDPTLEQPVALAALLDGLLAADW